MGLENSNDAEVVDSQAGGGEMTCHGPGKAELIALMPYLDADGLLLDGRRGRQAARHFGLRSQER